MFELLSNVQSVPIDQDALTMIHRGMNKVRVSVGEHNSEPSEVYIVTGLADSNLETYIIFYMLEPGIHVVYGFDQNPYESAMHESVLEEATNFVEEMGSILEEVPLEDMTPDQRAAWFDKEVLYSESIAEELEEIEDLEEIVELEAVEIDEIENVEPDPVDDPDDEIVVEISDDEFSQVLAEDDPEEDIVDDLDGEEFEDDEDQEPADDDQSGLDSNRMQDVVVAEGDFDELLKQAFLKPDVVEKTRRIPDKKDEYVPAEEPFPEMEEDDFEEEEPAEQEFEPADPGDSSDVDGDIRADVDSVPVESVETDQIDQDGPAVDVDDGVPDDEDDRSRSGGESGLEVIRYLSKF